MRTIKERLNTAELEFLSKHNISLDKLYDSTGMKTKDFKEPMKDLGKEYAVFTKPCTNGGHRMKTRSGHCLVCTSNKGSVFRNRKYADGYIYIAGTISGKKIKIGFTLNYNEREKSLNRTKYGNFSDWKILYSVGVKNAGKIEDKIDGKLKKYFSPGSYIKEGRQIATYEMFNCSFKKAKSTIEELKLGKETDEFIFPDAERIYSFKNIESDDIRDGQKNENIEQYKKKEDTGKMKKEIDKLKSFSFQNNSTKHRLEENIKTKNMFTNEHSENNMVINTNLNRNYSVDKTNTKNIFQRIIIFFESLFRLFITKVVSKSADEEKNVING